MPPCPAFFFLTKSLYFQCVQRVGSTQLQSSCRGQAKNLGCRKSCRAEEREEDADVRKPAGVGGRGLSYRARRHCLRLVSLVGVFPPFLLFLSSPFPIALPLTSFSPSSFLRDRFSLCSSDCPQLRVVLLPQHPECSDDNCEPNSSLGFGSNFLPPSHSQQEVWFT